MPSSPKSVYLPSSDEDLPAVRSTTSLVAVIQEALMFGTADLFPAVVTYENGTEDVYLCIAVNNPEEPGTAAYGVAALLFSKDGSSPATTERALSVQALVVEALDLEAAQTSEQAAAAADILADADALKATIEAEEAEVTANQATDERYASDD